MKTPITYLIEHYGCKDLEDLQKCFLNPMEISITMLTEAIELAQKDAYNQAIEDSAVNAECYDPHDGWGEWVVDRNSIRSLKK